MVAPLAKFIDWSVLQSGYAMLPQSIWREAANDRDLKLEQAVQKFSSNWLEWPGRWPCLVRAVADRHHRSNCRWNQSP